VRAASLPEPTPKRSRSFATISSAQEKSSSVTCEKSMTFTDRASPISASCASISPRTAAPVGRVTRLL
jgi:hypothetical protein